MIYYELIIAASKKMKKEDFYYSAILFIEIIKEIIRNFINKPLYVHFPKQIPLENLMLIKL